MADLAEDRLEYASLAAPKYPACCQLVDLWRSHHDKGGLVMGRDIPSRAFARLLRSIMVLEPLDAGRDFRVRLAGSGLRRRWDREITGLTLSEIFGPASLPAQLELTRRVLATGGPVLQWGTNFVSGVARDRREIALLPILSPDQQKPWVLAGVFYID